MNPPPIASEPLPAPNPASLVEQYKDWWQLVDLIKSQVAQAVSDPNTFGLAVEADTDMLKAQLLVQVRYRLNGEDRRVEDSFSLHDRKTPAEILDCLEELVLADLRRVAIRPALTQAASAIITNSYYRG